METVVGIFTVESKERVLAQNGTQFWKAAKWRAPHLRFAVLFQNTRPPDDWEFADGTAPHGHAFLVARISGLEPASDDRYKFVFSEWAEVHGPPSWDGSRFPLRYYTDLAALGIDEQALAFQPMPPQHEPPRAPRPAQVGLLDEVRALIAERLRMPADEVDVVVHLRKPGSASADLADRMG
jgi:hypothetical protein